jgi:hypothetical protein
MFDLQLSMPVPFNGHDREKQKTAAPALRTDKAE